LFAFYIDLVYKAIFDCQQSMRTFKALNLPKIIRLGH
jgi:hypothetical protein